MLWKPELHRLLVALFAVDALRRFIELGPDGAKLAAEVHWQQPLADLANDVIAVLEKHGAIDDGFFDRMTEAREGHRERIERVRLAWCAATSAGSDTPSDGGERPSRRPTSWYRLGVVAAAVSAAVAVAWWQPWRVDTAFVETAELDGGVARADASVDAATPLRASGAADAASVADAEQAQPLAREDAQPAKSEHRARSKTRRPEAAQDVASQDSRRTSPPEAPPASARWRVARAERNAPDERIPTRLVLDGPALPRGSVLRLDRWDSAAGRDFRGVTRCRAIGNRRCLLDPLAGNPACAPGDEFILDQGTLR